MERGIGETRTRIAASMERDDAVGGPRRLRVNTKAPRRFTTPPAYGPCLTYPRLSGTNHFHCRLRATTRARRTSPAPTSLPAVSCTRRDAFRKPSAHERRCVPCGNRSSGVSSTFLILDRSSVNIGNGMSRRIVAGQCLLYR